MKKIILSFSFSKEKGFSEIILNGQNVEEQIRTMDVSKLVSKVSSIVAVRHQMVAQQRLMGKQKKNRNGWSGYRIQRFSEGRAKVLFYCQILKFGWKEG